MMDLYVLFASVCIAPMKASLFGYEALAFIRLDHIL